MGRRGDVVVLSADYFAVPDEDLKRIYSALTVVNGRVVHTGPVRYEASSGTGQAVLIRGSHREEYLRRVTRRG